MYNMSSSPTITNCIFKDNVAAQGGGGMYNKLSNPTITGCSFLGNSSTSGNGEGGGGMYNESSSPIVKSCLFKSNSIYGASGAGMFNDNNSNPTVTYCTFIENSMPVGVGGGICNDGNAFVSHCLFVNNYGSDASGGGVYNGFGSNTVINHCVFIGNRITWSGWGGGIYNSYNSNSIVSNCTFYGNSTAGGIGGGMCNELSNSTVINCIFSGNSVLDESGFGGGGLGGGIMNLNSDTILLNCSFTNNSSAVSGGGIYTNNNNLSVTNTILWKNVPNEINSNKTPNVTYSCVKGGWPGIGNIELDPQFVDPNGPDNIPGTEDDNLRLQANSPCIDAGDNNELDPNQVTTDVAGRLRFVEDLLTGDSGNGIAPLVDMGAYEYACEGNMNEIAAITLPDFSLFTQHWLTDDCGFCGGADFTSDNNVTTDDFIVQIANWLCGTE